jgi:hypothetical protein
MCPHSTIYVSRHGQVQVLDKRPQKKGGVSRSAGKEKGVEAGKGGGGWEAAKEGGVSRSEGGGLDDQALLREIVKVFQKFDTGGR